MNREIVVGNWRQLKGKMLEHWGHFLDDGFIVLEGRHEQWAGQMEEARGIARLDSQRRHHA
ncbi:CsbD family protein [Usitatibacter palustris]|uniref:CsbD-like n=1 Tax=Usitatibacter palustris TaxID=2732487 RepID=A0A6M4H6J1_9PROT|nr:CsbD family protein [Usitatibacter palustris]QJR15140.1 hypothetical protein DSM104440_01957 [Usitatibacter palustris]